eukprot:COSAG01_NODE_783_length_13630_cov_5.556459_15_plen_139_part_00
MLARSGAGRLNQLCAGGRWLHQGNFFFGDDANVPSLLALPFYGYVHASDPVYVVSRAFPSWKRSILAEICLCHARSCHAIEDGNARAGHALTAALEPHQPLLLRWVASSSTRAPPSCIRMCVLRVRGERMGSIRIRTD